MLLMKQVRCVGFLGMVSAANISKYFIQPSSSHSVHDMTKSVTGSLSALS